MPSRWSTAAKVRRRPSPPPASTTDGSSPPRERALKMVAKLSAEARMLGAINCAVNRPAGLYGDNTDARGLERDLESLGVALEGATAIVIGAGGAAASAVVACLRRGASEVVIA